MEPASPDIVAKTLRNLRVLWIASLVGQLLLLGVVLYVLAQRPAPIPGAKPGQPGAVTQETVRLLFYVAMLAVVVLVPVGYVIRSQMYKRAWRGEVIAPGGYFVGNLILLAILEGLWLMNMVMILVTDWLGAFLVPGAIVLALFLANWPHGRPMEPLDSSSQFPSFPRSNDQPPGQP